MIRSLLVACSRSVGSAAFLALGAIGASDLAKADPPGPAYWLYDRSTIAAFERGQFYGSLTLKAGVQQMPRFNSNLSVFDEAVASKPFGGPLALTNHDVLGVRPGGEIGYVFRDGTFPAWMGRRERGQSADALALNGHDEVPSRLVLVIRQVAAQ